MLSQLRGKPLEPWEDTTLDGWLRRRAQGPDALWLCFRLGKEQKEWSLAALDALTDRWAEALAPHAGPGARVAVCLPNSPDFVGAFFGAMRLGAIAVPLPWPVAEPDAERLKAAVTPHLQKSGACALVTTPGVAAGCAWPLPTLTTPADAAPQRSAMHGSDQPAFIQFTSGSTGMPRGAVISHRAALASARGMAEALGAGPHDVGMSWLPFFHDMGLVGVMLCSLVAGFPVHITRPADFLMRPRRWLELLSELGGTLTAGPNFAYATVLKRVKDVSGLDLSKLQRALNGSEPVHRATLDGIAQLLAPAGLRPGVQLPVYGLAEATLGVCFARVGDAFGDLLWQGRSVPPCGTPIPGIELEVRDGEGRVVEQGTEGQVFVRGPSLMSGYFEDPESTARALQDGWLATGDLGVVQGGTLYVTGREKELIVKAGSKFHPYDIERVVHDCLDTTPNGVAAFSVPDASLGTEALVVLAELRRAADTGPLVELVRAKLVEALGVRADRIELLPAGALPRTTSGKVKREALKRTWGPT